ncbi:MAG: hypothetical protein ABEJ72_09985, partial [Candidatus Aenigmatarchaeota archaeon]
MRVAVFGESPTELGGVETSVRCISEYSPEEIEFEFFCPGSKTRTEESEFG